MVKEINPTGWQGGVSSLKMAARGSDVIFGADDGTNGVELWVSDGTTEGTAMVSDLWPPEVADPGGEYSSSPDHFVTVGSSVYFRAYVPPDPPEPPADPYDCGHRLWITDGTEVGTEPLPICPTDSRWAVIGSSLYLFAQGESFGDALVKVTGTTVTVVEAFEPGRIFGIDLAVVDFDLYGPLLVFSIADADHGYELWTSDGTGAAMLKDIRPGVPNSNPQHITDFDGSAWFSATDSDGDIELWVSDGSASGTVQFIDLYDTASSVPRFLTSVDDQLFFFARDDVDSLQLWVTDGTVGGTHAVSAFTSDLADSYDVETAGFGGELYFGYRAADGDEFGFEVWVSDGTIDGTHVFFDARPGADGSSAYGFYEAGDRLFFTAYDESIAWYLWATDGTVEGTFRVLANGLAKVLAGSQLYFAGGYPEFFSGELFALPLPDFVTVPKPPQGEQSPNTGVPYTYNTPGGSVSTDGNRVQYRFNWGSQGDSGWLPFGDTSADVTWLTEGGHEVTVEARAENSGLLSSLSYPLYVNAVFEEVILETTLAGPELGEAGVEYAYTLTSGSNSDDALEYSIDWNDGTPVSWLPFDKQAGSIELTHAWQNLGSYEVVARVRCQNHVAVETTTTLWVEITDEFIDPVTLSGPASGYVGHTYDYTIHGESSFGHDLEYAVSWGDGEGNDIDWTPFPAGETTVTVSYQWVFEAPDFPVWAGVRCASHPEVDNGDDMTVEMVDPPPDLLFADGFETGDCGGWSNEVP
jgi:ELWxxDGT repeat protein